MRSEGTGYSRQSKVAHNARKSVISDFPYREVGGYQGPMVACAVGNRV